MKKYFKLTALFLSSILLASCENGLVITPTNDGGIVLKAQKKTAPAIKTFDFYPKNTTKKDDVITFSIKAESKSNEVLQYNWKSSKGTLLTNSGNTVSWKPINQNGNLESGLSTITVTVSDGTYTSDASANVMVNSDGSISSQNDSIKIAENNDNTSDKGIGVYLKLVPTDEEKDTRYVYQDIPKKSETSSYSYSYSYSSSTTNYLNTTVNEKIEKYYTECEIGDDYDYYSKIVKTKPSYSNIIFKEDFESGYIDDDWNISYPNKYSYKEYLTWKKLKDDNGNHVAVLTGPTDDILSNTYSGEIQMTSSAINLKNTKLPRLSLYAKNNANPSGSVKLNIYWSNDGKNLKPLNISFIPDQKWKKLDIDLKNLLRSYSPSVGFLTIGMKVSGNKNDFIGPMIDNITVYEGN
ncbi:MAG: hypothetical protein U0457_06565 [Candidatus Sericytochromatia bacterium]